MRAVGARIVAHRPRHVLHFVDAVQAHAAVFGHAHQPQQQHAISQIERMAHSSSPSDFDSDTKLDSAQRAFSNPAARRLTKIGGTSSSSPAIQKNGLYGTSRRTFTW